MVFVPNGKGGGWYEPPYTWEEEMELYRRMNAGPGDIRSLDSHLRWD